METVEKGCPFCHEDVVGDDENLFYCRKCNFLFTRKNLEIKALSPD